MITQSHLLHDIEQKHDDSHQSLEQNIIKLYEAKMLNSGYGWMYFIIVIEVVLLILLLYIGLWWNDEDNVAIIDPVCLHCFFFIGLFLGLYNRNDDNNWIWS